MQDNEQGFGKGALPAPPDPRNFKLGFIAGAPAPVDWSREFRLPEPPDSDQRATLRCVSEAWSYKHWQLKRKVFSKRDVYSQIFLSQGGAFLDAGGKVICKAGHQTIEECPDPVPLTESATRVRCASPERAADDIADRYFETHGNPDTLAQAVRDWGGAVFGLMVGKTGWEDRTNPRPPKPNAGGEGHALYAFGFHMHGGQKCVIAKSSWCRTVNGVRQHEHHIKQDYFDSGYVFPTAFVLVPKEKLPVIRRYIVQDGGKMGVMLVVDGTFESVIHWAKSEAMFQRLLADYEVPANAPKISI